MTHDLNFLAAYLLLGALKLFLKKDPSVHRQYARASFVRRLFDWPSISIIFAKIL